LPSSSLDAFCGMPAKAQGSEAEREEGLTLLAATRDGALARQGMTVPSNAVLATMTFPTVSSALATHRPDHGRASCTEVARGLDYGHPPQE